MHRRPGLLHVCTYKFYGKPYHDTTPSTETTIMSATHDTHKHAALLKRLHVQRDVHRGVLDKFAEEFAQDPARALRWSDGVFKAAAMAREIDAALHALEHDHLGVDFVREHFVARMKSHARYPEHSTSIPANLYHQYEGAAAVEILDTIQSYTE